MNNTEKELPKALTIDDIKLRIGKPIFIASHIHPKTTKWNIIKEISERQNLLYKYLEFIDGLTITYDKIDEFRFFDKEISEEELEEVLVLEKKTKINKKTGYEKCEDGVRYYYIDSFISADHSNYTSRVPIDPIRYKNANHFSNEVLCENIARAEVLKYRLRRFAALNGGIPSREDWENDEYVKFYIDYSYYKRNIIVCRQGGYCKTFGQIYFIDKDACERAIEIFRDELQWYFEEFEEQLY